MAKFGDIAGGLAQGIQTGFGIRAQQQELGLQQQQLQAKQEATQDAKEKQAWTQSKEQFKIMQDIGNFDAAAKIWNEGMLPNSDGIQIEVTGEMLGATQFGKQFNSLTDQFDKRQKTDNPMSLETLMGSIQLIQDSIPENLRGKQVAPFAAEISEIETGAAGEVRERELEATKATELRAVETQKRTEGRGEARALRTEERKPPTIAGIQAEIISDVLDGTKSIEDLDDLSLGLVNKAIASGRMTISVDPETGAFTFQQGGGGLSAPSTTRAEQVYTNGQSMLGVVEDIRDLLRPENIGLVGDVRMTVQGAVEQGLALAGRLTGMGDDISRRILQDGDDINASRWFDPKLTQQEYLFNVLAYKNAKNLDPGARLSDRDIKESKKSLQIGKSFIGIKGIASVLNSVESLTIREMKNANQLLGGRFTDPVSRAERLRLGKPATELTPEEEASEFMKGF